MGADRRKMTKAMFAALKPGSFLAVADHSARPEGGAAVGKSCRHIAEQTLRSEVEAARLTFVDDAAFCQTRVRASSRNSTPVDECVLRFQKPMQI